MTIRRVHGNSKTSKSSKNSENPKNSWNFEGSIFFWAGRRSRGGAARPAARPARGEARGPGRASAGAAGEAADAEAAAGRRGAGSGRPAAAQGEAAPSPIFDRARRPGAGRGSVDFRPLTGAASAKKIKQHFFDFGSRFGGRKRRERDKLVCKNKFAAPETVWELSCEQTRIF